MLVGYMVGSRWQIFAMPFNILQNVENLSQQCIDPFYDLSSLVVTSVVASVVSPVARWPSVVGILASTLSPTEIS